ncbi:TIGR04255 family protein [Schlesneria sp.]|uniref:TIGR04255 family protein n=1 Tax=Schlesneria sp. TaxID=2762018 RepID=UPI002F22CCF0
MNRELPDFGKPPLTEVALSVQFEPLEKLRTPQIGLIWNEFRQRFPITEEHVPIEPAFEQFGALKSMGPQVRFEMVETLPVPRIWFLNEPGTELIQIQPDRFIHNWRKGGERDTYPRYELLRKTFKTELETFREIVAREQCGVIHPNQCEVTYVNHIVAGQGWSQHSEIAEVLTIFPSGNCEAGELENVNFSARFILRNDEQKPIGRLHATVQPLVQRESNRSMIAFTLTARLRPDGESDESVLSSLDRGREVIVRSFAQLTTPQMHKIWERKDG